MKSKKITIRLTNENWLNLQDLISHSGETMTSELNRALVAGIKWRAKQIRNEKKALLWEEPEAEQDQTNYDPKIAETIDEAKQKFKEDMKK